MALSNHKIVAIHQPNYLPWLGYFHRISIVDDFVFFDHVQMPRGKTITSRNKIRLGDNWIWLTVPTLSSGKDGQRICDVEIDYKQDWIRKHVGTLRQAYQRSLYFNVYIDGILEILNNNYRFLADLNIALILFLCKQLDINANFIKSSNLVVHGGRTEAIVEICRQLKADEYISGTGCLDFLEPSRFLEAGINLKFQHVSYPEYIQVSSGFIPNLSVVDLLFNYGPKSIDVLRNVGRIAESQEVNKGWLNK